MVASNGLMRTDSSSASASDAGRCDELMTLLVHQRTLYRRLGVLAERQRTLVLSDDPSAAGGLLELLGERQRLVDGLSGLGARMAPFRENWTNIYNAMDEAGKRRVSELLEEVNGMLGTILQRDGQDCGTLSVRRQGIADRLSATANASQASVAYASAATGAAGRSLTDACA